ncbi:hypothetical protein [Terrihalobacillus insolitus]|uniref:hypothetical protein n=1 Tax=Terrihalobacillus insolitus TaxID=2950438 RepID=UPI00233F7E1B|nr:hypothetical protein [Terrihalobacillus insolitus]MDC3413964.1 hypothetical protein [Terrihalobacillus insolitus]
MIPTPHSITVIKSNGLDAWGEPIEGEVIEIQGNLRTQTKVVRNNNGKEVVSSYTILFVGFVDVKHEDKVRFTEPNGEVKTLDPINVKFMRDLDGSVAFTRIEA